MVQNDDAINDYKDLAWMLDSGATNHYISNRHILRDFKHYIKPVGITTGGGKIMAEGIGEVMLNLTTGKKILKDIMWTPHLKGNYNLLSILQLVIKGYKIELSKEGGRVILGDEVISRCALLSVLTSAR